MRRIIILLAFLIAAVPCSAQSWYTYQVSDTANTASSAWPLTTGAGHLIVGYAGTQLTGGQISGPFLGPPSTLGVTMSDGTVMTQCGQAACDFTGVTSMDTRLWLGTSAGGTTPTIKFNTSMAGQTIGGVGIELAGVNTLDQISSNGFTSQAISASLTSNSITTTQSNEIVLCLAQEANPIAAGNHFKFQISAGWTPVAFGNQAFAYRVEASPGTFSCTVTLEAGVPSNTTEDIAMTIVSFYQSGGGGGGGGGGAPVTYYVAPAGSGGSDSNDGLAATVGGGHGPWLSPGHAVNCGDVISAVSGTYSYLNFTSGKWGPVTCPANNNVAWVKCATFDACSIKPVTDVQPIWIDSSYWGVQGFEVSNPTTAASACLQVSSASGVHHVIFANNIINQCGGNGVNSNNNGQAGVDYLVIMGNWIYKSAQYTYTMSVGNECWAAISTYQPVAHDAVAGTHLFYAGNFINDTANFHCAGSGTGSYSGTGILFDTFDGDAFPLNQPYAQQVVAQNNICMYNAGPCLEAYDSSSNGAGGPYATFILKHNTGIGDNQATDAFSLTSGVCAELRYRLDSFGANNVTATYNLFKSTLATACGGNPVYDITMSYVTGYTVNNNWSISIGTGCTGAPCYSEADNSTASPGSGYTSEHTGTDPAFPAITDPGAPSCGSASSVPNCLAGTLTNLIPTAGGATAYGYQPTGAPAYDPLFPQWLCNVQLPAGITQIGCASTFSVGGASKIGGASVVF